MRIYGLKNCDSCRKVVKDLTSTGITAELVDIRAAPLGAEMLERFLAAFGDDLVNRKSTTWRGLSEAERAGAPLQLLAAHPALMKRPVIEAGDQLCLGWGTDTRAALLG